MAFLLQLISYDDGSGWSETTPGHSGKEKIFNFGVWEHQPWRKLFTSLLIINKIIDSSNNIIDSPLLTKF